MQNNTQTAGKTKCLPASELTVERLQTRAAMNLEYVADLAERVQDGDEFPPITVVSDGDTLWLTDGSHRLDAALEAGKEICVAIIPGTRTEAVELACGANRAHGLRRTNADKRHAVELALRELDERSDRLLADLCGVSPTFVGSVRSEVSTMDTSKPKRTGKDGKRYTVTSNTPATRKSNGVDDFEPADIEAETAADPPQASAESGTSIVSPNVREACRTYLGKLVRALTDAGIYDQFIESLDQIAERLEQI